MKSGTENKLKFKQLQKRLDLPEWGCEGLLSALWRFTRSNAPDGNLGKFTREEIAIGIDWRDCPNKLIEQLIAAKWLDPVGCKLLVHDWWDHCEDNTHRQLARARQWFACGKAPKLNKLEQHERKEAADFYATHSPPSAHGQPTESPATAPGHVPSHTMPSPTQPSLTGERLAGGGGDISISEEQRPKLADEANRIYRVLYPKGGGNDAEDREIIFKAAILSVADAAPECVLEGALAAVKKTKPDTPARFLRAAIRARSPTSGVDEDLIDRIAIPPWAREMFTASCA